MTKEERATIEERIRWLKQKLASQRNPHSPEYTLQKLLVGRTEGNIGALEWVLRNLEPNTTKSSK